MALSRRGQSRFAASIWPGFVDAMTALILVLFFVLSIFMIVQFVLRDTISGQDREIETQDRQLDELGLQVANLADALGLERTRADTQEALVATLTDQRSAAEARISALSAERDAAAAQIADLTDEAAAAAARISAFEDQVASLIARNTDVAQALEAAQAESAERLSRAEALDLALASARDEIDAGVEEARLAAARREALEALTASLRADVAGLEETVTNLRTETAEGAEALSAAEAERLAEAAAAEALRERLANADAELTAMTLNLEEQRREAEETLTLLAAAEAARKALAASETEALSEAERQAAQLAQAEALLAEQTDISAEAQRNVALLNQQTAELRAQLDSLQGLLDTSAERDVTAQVQIESLGRNLNAALARVAVEEAARAEAEIGRTQAETARAEAETARAEAEFARAELEARERERLEEEAKDLRRFRSEFFARMSQVLGAREGVQVVGDRFVFPSEVLFAPGSATLGAEGRAQVARVAGVIREIADDVPEEIDWVLRVDGHTDRTPVSPGSRFRDNWELSQERALSVVRYMTESLGLPADRLAATGFGEFQPVDEGSSPEALARNRRIELKFTER